MGESSELHSFILSCFLDFLPICFQSISCVINVPF